MCVYSSSNSSWSLCNEAWFSSFSLYVYYTSCPICLIEVARLFHFHNLFPRLLYVCHLFSGFSPSYVIRLRRFNLFFFFFFFISVMAQWFDWLIFFFVFCSSFCFSCCCSSWINKRRKVENKLINHVLIFFFQIWFIHVVLF